MMDFVFEKHGVDFCTPISNRFLMTYMPKASGSFVKVYLFLYVHFFREDASLSPASVASELNLSEADVMEALGYWQNEGLLSVVRDKNTCRIDFRPCGSCPGPFDGTDPKGGSSKTAPKLDTTVVKIGNPPDYSPEELALYQNNAEISKLFEEAEAFLGAPVTVQNLSLLYSFYDFYRMPLDVIRFLMNHCAESDHRNFRYMEKIIQNWSDLGIKTLDEAQAFFEKENRATEVLALFGVKDKKPSDKEQALALSWLDEFKCSMDLIAEAARRTLSAIGKASLPYADAIIKNWLNSGITTVEAANKNDAQYGQVGNDYEAIAAQMQKKRFNSK